MVISTYGYLTIILLVHVKVNFLSFGGSLDLFVFNGFHKINQKNYFKQANRLGVLVFIFKLQFLQI